MTHFCPSCGFNLRNDEVVERDGFRLDPRGLAEFEGRYIDIPVGYALILHALASNEGRAVSLSTLLSRVSDGDYPQFVAVLVCRMRRTLQEAGIPNPIQTVYGRGYRWHVEREA